MRNSLLVGAISVAALVACGDADMGTFQRHSVTGADPAESQPAADDPTSPADVGGSGPTATDDAGAGATPTGAGASNGDAGPKTCLDGVASPGGGKHHAGADCASCHDSLGASRRWTIAGTLYSAATGGSAVSGATIVVVDAAGKKITLTTYDNGNFYTTQTVTKPLKVRATKCPSDLSMGGAVSNGSCNASSCHDSSMRIHLP